MLITPIKPLNSVPVSFKSNILTKEIDTRTQTEKDDSDKLVKTLKGLAIASAVVAGYSVLKMNNIDPIHKATTAVKNLVDKYSNKPTPDPIIEKLNGKRDAAAVKQYKSIIAQNKLRSLQTRLLDGDFNEKSQEAFQSIIKNSKKLAREALIDIPR